MLAMPAAQTASPEERKRVLIVDDDPLINEFLKACIRSAFPEVSVTTYDPERQGRPTTDLDWTAHDVLLLDYNLGNGETGVDWLRRYAGLPGFPPTILITAETSPIVVGKAVHSGAVAYLNKSELTPESLEETLREVLESVPAESDPDTAEPADTGTTASTDDGSPDGFPVQDALDTGTAGANYRFIRQIGSGGMPRVYLAERSEDRTTVVLKLLARDISRDAENVQRFAREGELLARVDSPYVVKIFDHGTTNSYGYIAMEFFGRGDLAQRMTQSVSADDAVLYLHNIALGLDAIHRHGIVHRDLKPGNIMFRGDGSMALVDFGLSKRIGTDLTLTETGVILGTPYCMSPEQTHGLVADHRADLYAAGVMFYEMLTGERPFTALSLPSLLQAIQTEPAPKLPPELQRYQPVLDRLLDKDPDKRYQSAGELIDAIQDLVTAT
jgi:CheY-like chemotaxis protein